MSYDPKFFRSPYCDKFILSKGHAAAIYYAALAESGIFPVKNLLNFKKLASELESHPTPRLSCCEVATGSLGQGFGFACGQAYASKYYDYINNKYFCLMGDGECAEGSVWEAAQFATYYKLDNLITIIDVNSLGQSMGTCIRNNLNCYEQRFKAFGFHTITIDGHDVKEIIKSLIEARNTKDKPTVITCKTFKGKYFMNDIENKLNWENKPKIKESAKVIDYISGIMKNSNIKLTPTKSKIESTIKEFPSVVFKVRNKFDINIPISNRVAFGQSLLTLGEQDTNNQIIVLDCDVKNTTMTEFYEKAHKDKFINCFISEQNMISVALGLSKRNKIPFCSTYGAFYSRAFDQIRTAAMSNGNIKFFGSHSGIEAGKDGPSVMALEDIAMFRTIQHSIIFYPSDAVSMERAVELAVNTNGLVYIKGGKSKHKIIYHHNEEFQIGKAKVLRNNQNDKLTIISAGPTIFEAIKVYDFLLKEGIHARIVDLFSIKPIDEELLKKCAQETGLIYILEDHYPEGGIGGILYFLIFLIEAVCCTLKNEKSAKIFHFAVNELPKTGSKEELYDLFKLSANKIQTEILNNIKDINKSNLIIQ